jgi:hypothetical protein
MRKSRRDTRVVSYCVEKRLAHLNRNERALSIVAERGAWESYFDPYVDLTGRITGYQLVDLHALGKYDWRLALTNIWKVENYLLKIPHRELRSSNRRYLPLLARFRAYRERQPRGPVVEIYLDRQAWM